MVDSDLPGRGDAQDVVLETADDLLADQAGQPFGQAYDPPNQDCAWGSNSAILNGLQVVGTAYDLTGEQRYADGVVQSMDWVLGRNAMDLSYVTGYGEQFAQNQHSRWYPHQLDPDLPRTPDGTLAGGPNSTAVQAGDPVAVEYLGVAWPRPATSTTSAPGHQRDHHQLERPDGLGRRLPDRAGRGLRDSPPPPDLLEGPQILTQADTVMGDRPAYVLHAAKESTWM